MFSLKRKTVLITGASGGIGKKIAESMYKQGANIVLSGTNEEALKNLSIQLGENCTYFIADLRSNDDIESLAKNAESYKGQIDILINFTRSSCFWLPEVKKILRAVMMRCPLSMKRTFVKTMTKSQWAIAKKHLTWTKRWKPEMEVVLLEVN